MRVNFVVAIPVRKMMNFLSFWLKYVNNVFFNIIIVQYVPKFVNQNTTAKVLEKLSKKVICILI